MMEVSTALSSRASTRAESSAPPIAGGDGTPYALVLCERQRNAVETMNDSTRTRRPVVETLAGADLTIGTHLVTGRFGYTHHGLYAGGGKVVHYAGLSRSLRCGPVQEVSLAAFAHGHPVWIRQSPDARFAGLKAIRRAYSRLGEDRYRLISNNCEHFCTWCLYGESRSDQINAWKFWITDHLMAAVVNTVRQLAITSWSICS
ncbi:lecithin retinol acyltransferase family protein [Paraburkholderia azotifigens]|uniref:lecithin retinol acyltransferase family protein n=1 Tax=Paraburkholderia azotifigens TaxID=2057004 RepID=UPI003CCC837C